MLARMSSADLWNRNILMSATRCCASTTRHESAAIPSTLRAETGFFGDLPSDVAIEVDTAGDNISRLEHTGRKVNPSGTGAVWAFMTPNTNAPSQDSKAPIAKHARTSRS